jgi:hypothetical protein
MSPLQAACVVAVATIAIAVWAETRQGRWR